VCSRLDATAQAELVRRGEAQAEELVAAACERIERLDGRLGAVPVRFFAEAALRAQALPPGGELRGVPFLMKDVGARQAGQPYYAGNRALRDADHRAKEDTPLGARFRELGLVTVGNSSSPEFGLQSNTWPLAYGPTRNPWDPARAAGGSSGGACAAVASGMVPVAHASDGAGSIRIPAAWCGLVGLKPSRDRVLWRLRAGRPEVEFAVARTLRDTAALLDALRPASARRKSPQGYRSALRADPGRLRVGTCNRSPAGTPVHAACVAAVEATAAALSARGHEVEEAAPDSLFEYEERAAHGAVLGPLGYREVLLDLEQHLGRAVGPEDVEPFLWEWASLATADAGARQRAVAFARGWVQRTLGWFERFAVLVTPTVCEPAPPLEDFDPHRLGPVELMARMVPHMAFTEPWNATGQPALSLPLGWSDAGLPVGVQLVAAPGREDLLLALAAGLLEDLGRPERLPAVHA